MSGPLKFEPGYGSGISGRGSLVREYYIDLGLKDVRTGLYNNFDFDEDGIPRYRFPIGLL
jgi:hypothetical protein